MESYWQVNTGLDEPENANLTAPNKAASHPFFNTLQVGPGQQLEKGDLIWIALTQQSP